jgi:hypothetical protein
MAAGSGVQRLCFSAAKKPLRGLSLVKSAKGGPLPRYFGPTTQRGHVRGTVGGMKARPPAPQTQPGGFAFFNINIPTDQGGGKRREGITCGHTLSEGGGLLRRLRSRIFSCSKSD